MRLFFLILFCATVTNSFGQTCCSGGVPISGNIGLPRAEAGTFQVSLDYDFNNLRTLQFEGERLDDKLRERTTRSALLNIGYALSSKWSADLMLTHVTQVRKSFSPFGDQVETTNGIGDAVVLVKYQIGKAFQLGLGSKMPVGSTNLTGDYNIPYPADMQPGSGAWDGIAFARYQNTLEIRPSASFDLAMIIRKTGVNKDYLGSQAYRFGNEIQLRAGVGDQFVIGSRIINPSLSLKGRLATADNVDGTAIPSSGGRWLFINPGAGVVIFQGLQLNVNVEVPLSSFVDGTQLTPTVRVNGGLFYSFNLKNNGNEININ